MSRANVYKALLITAAVVLGWSLPSHIAKAETLTHVVVAATGDAAPSQEGTINRLHNPVTQKADQVFFSATIIDNSGFLLGDGVFRADSQTLDLIAAQGQPSPDGNGNLGPMNGLSPFVNSDNAVAFVNTQTNTFNGFFDSHTILYGGGGSGPLEVAFRSDQLIPDGSGERFTYSPPSLIGFNAASQVAFSTSTATGDPGIWRRDKKSSALVKIVLTGDRNPSDDGFMSGGVAFGIGATMNDKGEVAFADFVALDTGPALEGIYRGSGPGSLVKIARQGDPAPMGDGLLFDFLWDSGLPVNAHGHVAFIGLLSGTPGGSTDNVALFRGNGSEMHELARKGDSVPDGNGSFLFNIAGYPIMLNNRGEVLFATTVTGAANGATFGLFLADQNEVVQVARLNAPAPGGGVFSSFGTLMALNNLGQVVFIAAVSEGVSSFTALFVYEDGMLSRLVREGDTLPNHGSISSIITSSDVVDGLRPERSLLNDAGQVTYNFYANGKEGIALADFPCLAMDDLELSGFDVYGIESYQACNTIAVGSVNVQTLGELHLRAGDRVILQNGFRVLSGGKLTVRVDRP